MLANKHTHVKRSLTEYNGYDESEDFKMKPVNDGRIEFHYDMLTSHDINYLTKHGMLTDGKISEGLEFYIMNKSQLHIVTDKKSWQMLAGRHWIYDLNTKKLELIIMN